ncbi:MFS transporter [Tepidimonas charontis]|uniref:Putative 3-phenylpropionic acid transporter n=1 Tax=Tepidimonas charontis TaxID=2267262 RepID=A0A554X748_9BURK|nr:MFS transporter [Tepidimonas charontis]TSE31659.1 putative 3-phenylpropionic acid transporter [Tepidimonas charontis]
MTGAAAARAETVADCRLWPFAALSAGYFAHIGFFNPYLPLWLQSLGYGLWAIGMLTALQSATRVFAPYLWGWLSDRSGDPVRWLRRCAGVALVVSLGLWGAPQPWWLPLVLSLLFTHTSAMMPLSETALAHAVSASGGFDAQRYGRVRLWGSLGFLLTVVLAGAWFERHGLGSFPFWANATLVLVLLAAWAMPRWRDAPHASASVVPLRSVLRRPLVAWFFVALFLHVLAHVFIYIFFSLYLDALGYGKRVIGALWAAGVAVEVLWFFTQGRFVDRLSLPGWLALAAALASVRLAATAWAAQWLAVLVAAQLLHALTFAAHHTACISFISRHFAGPLRARGQAMYSLIGYGLSGVVAGALGGWVSSAYGLRAVFVVATLVAVGATAAAWRVRQLAQ